ncbi:MAG: transcription antitermination factor NusB [Bryobacteraceae bacterium]
MSKPVNTKIRRISLLHNGYCNLLMRVTGVSMSRISSGRRVAFEALAAVEHGAFASDSLRHLSAALDSRNAGLAAQIVFGCLRYRAQLDFLILHYSSRHAESLDEPVRLALRMGIFQLRYLDRVPAHAAVHESVELAKQHRRAASGFANAVLRKVTREPIAWPDEATGLSLPNWLLERWKEHFGSDKARRIARAGLEEPRKYVGQTIGVLPTRFQDIGSQSIIPLLDLQPGQSYLDLCAAPGNKTLQALETPLSLAIACDISEKRMREISRVCPLVILDAARPLPFSRLFDRIFIDAPCSGTGTIARNPEIKWRVEPKDFGRFGEKQSRILGHALPLLAPHGKLLYATCSLEPEENENVVRLALAEHPRLRLERSMWRLPGMDEGDGFFAAVFSVIRSSDPEAGS